MSSSVPTRKRDDPGRIILRHALATLAYPGSKVLRDAPDGFASFTCGGGCRSAGAVLAHIGDLLDWALARAKGEQKWRDTPPQSWEETVNHFYDALAALDGYLGSDQPLQAPVEKLLQGPIADALTHIGQIAIMRRLAGAAVKGENYFAARIAIGQVGPTQAAPQHAPFTGSNSPRSRTQCWRSSQRAGECRSRPSESLPASRRTQRCLAPHH